MNFFGKDKLVRFTFELENGELLPLTYLLQPNSLREKWLNEVQTYLNEDGTYLNLKIANKNYSQLKQLTEELNSIVKKINYIYGYEIVVPLDGTGDVCREKLNNLHEKFEEYGEHSSYNGGSLFRGQKAHDLWLDLNEWIHITEIAMETTEKDFPQYSALVTVYPPYPGRKLEEKDKLFLTTESLWGHLYLGYNTLGKDYMHAAQDNDVRVITNNQVKVQELYSSEVWLSFQGRSYFQKVTEMEFYQWYETLDQEAQEKIPIENLNTLALGRYYLGIIMIDDHFLNIHPVKKDWYIKEELQKKWNEQVFSQVKSVTKIELIT